MVYGQNGMDKIVYGQNGSVYLLFLTFGYYKLNSIELKSI